MPAPRKPDKSGDRERDRDEGGDEGYKRPRRRRHERPHGRGREREIFLDYVTRRWDGSPPPSAEAYAQAERLWRQLPGAVITLPTDLGGPPEQPPPGGGDGGQGEGQES
jgi:hypothetical protein